MAKRVEYKIVGKYMSGKEVTGYELKASEKDKNGKYGKDEVAFLVGKGQITNCTGQIYNDKVVLKGKGMNLSDLPVKEEKASKKK